MANKKEKEKSLAVKKAEFYAKIIDIVFDVTAKNMAESQKKMDFKIQFSGRNRYIKFSEYGFKMNILLYTRGQVVIQLDEMFNGKFEQQIYEFTEDETEQEQFLVRIRDILAWMLPIFCDKAVVDAHTFTDYLRDDIETAIENVKADWKNYGDREF